MNTSCHTYKRLMLHMSETLCIWTFEMSHATHTNDTYGCATNPQCALIYSCIIHIFEENMQVYKCVMSHIWMHHVEENLHVYECVMSHIRMYHVTHLNESCHTYWWVMSRIWVTHMDAPRTPYDVQIYIYIHKSEENILRVWVRHFIHVKEIWSGYD